MQCKVQKGWGLYIELLRLLAFLLPLVALFQGLFPVVGGDGILDRAEAALGDAPVGHNNLE